MSLVSYHLLDTTPSVEIEKTAQDIEIELSKD